jgi:predicted Zn-dependent peptidase
MTIKKYFKKFTVLALFLFQIAAFSFAQTTIQPAPREEKLLNGLKLLVWSNPKAEKTSVKLRIHSGAAFDPLAKEGVMALLGDILFPNESVKEYFADDLGGSLEITSNYDYIQIEASGDNDKILEILEAIAQAVTKPQIDKETTAKVKTARLEKVKYFENNPSYIADRAVANRLFGNYPYGRAQSGTSESVSKIDFADILLAKQKFLTADNATLAISGNVRYDLIFRAARRYFGGWEKADKKVPPTFTQPDAPVEKPLEISNSSFENNEVWVAMNGVARKDKDFYASRILVKIMADRTENAPADSIKSESYLLNGIFIMSIKPDSTKILTEQGDKIKKFEFSQAEFEKAKTEVLAELNQKNLSDFWLDVETYKLTSVKDEIQTANNVTLEAVQKISDKLIKQPKAMIIISKAVKTN